MAESFPMIRFCDFPPGWFPNLVGLDRNQGADPVTRLALLGPGPVGFSAPFTRLEPNWADPVAI